jgi:hypothetical protein
MAWMMLLDDRSVAWWSFLGQDREVMKDSSRMSSVRQLVWCVVADAVHDNNGFSDGR